ncbi:hypothetical protein K7432_015387 [Basidiobolus ranarum]|uniref:Leucine-rich repeat-containing protein 69 n=1 Tax=Basidiobolus ranarum TaxID=34480 RepID=A0ABR2WG56_9FUNG
MSRAFFQEPKCFTTITGLKILLNRQQSGLWVDGNAARWRKFLRILSSLTRREPTKVIKLSPSYQNIVLLDLQNTGLSQLSEVVFDLVYLKEVRLRGNLLEEIPLKCSVWKYLEVCDLSYNRLTSIPSEVLKAWSSTLKVLGLGGNLLQELPQEIGELKELVALGLRDNQITSLPELSGLTKLNALNVAHNRLKTLPSSISDCAGLETIFAFNNEIIHIPSSLGKMKKLHSLFLTKNFIRYLPADILEIPDLVLQISEDFLTFHLDGVENNLVPLPSLREITGLLILKNFTTKSLPQLPIRLDQFLRANTSHHCTICHREVLESGVKILEKSKLFGMLIPFMHIVCSTHCLRTIKSRNKELESLQMESSN